MKTTNEPHSNVIDLVTRRDIDATPRKSRKPKKSKGLKAHSTKVDVTLRSNGNYSRHACEKIASVDGAVGTAMDVAGYEFRLKACREDCETLSAMELRKRYPGEASTHKNMSKRSKHVSPEFQKFRDFLKHVGPKNSAKATLDRIDNADPEYAPGKVAWADRRTQNANRNSVNLFRHPVTHKVYTVAEIATVSARDR